MSLQIHKFSCFFLTMLTNTVLANIIHLHLKLLSCTHYMVNMLLEEGYCCTLDYQIVVCALFSHRKMSHHKQKLVCSKSSLCKIVSYFLIMACHFIEKKHQHDPDYGMGLSKFTAKSTTFSKVSYYHTSQWCVYNYSCMSFSHSSGVLGSTGKKAGRILHARSAESSSLSIFHRKERSAGC